MRNLKLVTVVGARPQFIKAAAVSRAIAANNAASGSTRISERIVHTGQHYDANMSEVFFRELEIPPPAVNLEIGSGTHGAQTGAMLQRLEETLTAERPDWVLVYGDTNSTLAGALAAAKLGIPVAHVEAGLRSFNRAMPEEINRVVTDRLSSLLLCPTRQSVANLIAEGIEDGMRQTGDVMYDSVLFHADRAKQNRDVFARAGVTAGEYVLATVHRAENADDVGRLAEIIAGLSASRLPVVMPVHPRTRARVAEAGVRLNGSIRAMEPVGYLEMLALERAARAIVTDSGGVQKEAYFLGVPCVTVREETEWVELVEAGWNRLVGADRAAIAAGLAWASASDRPPKGVGLYGDGRAAEKVVAELIAAAA